MKSKSTLLLAFAFVNMPANATHAEIGIKLGSQLYANGLNSPLSFAKGIFFNVPISETWALEGGVTSLGEGKEKNDNIGSFDVAEFSAMYNFAGNENSHFFAKLGVAPWVGHIDQVNGDSSFDFGVSPVFGLGYKIPLFERINGRVEYQYIPRLGGDTIGYTDSHSLSLGISWRSGTNSTSSVQSDAIYKERPTSNDTALERPPKAETNPNISALDSTSSPKISPSFEREVFASWLFDTNSSQLVIPKPFTPLDEARALISSGCQLKQIIVTGYSDGSGEPEYNLWLSEQRAQRVTTYLQSALGHKNNITTYWYGSERLGETTIASAYERRVDFQLNYTCRNENDHG